MMSDLYTKAVLTVIAAASVAIVAQNHFAPEPAYVPDPCGIVRGSPCYITSASEDGLEITPAQRDGLRVKAFEDDFRVTVAQWGVLQGVPVSVENWP